MGEHLKKLKLLRSEKGISQKEIADYLGITVAAYSLYERGEREPNISTLRKIAEYYGVTVDELVENKGIKVGELFAGVGEQVAQDIETFAAHIDAEEFTEEELEEIRQFAEFVKSKRKKD